MPARRLRIQGAVEEVRRVIAGRYPGARFDVFERDDSEGGHPGAPPAVTSTHTLVPTSSTPTSARALSP